MKEIKFRGKSIKTGNWVFGSLVQRHNKIPFILNPYEDLEKINNTKCEVQLDTIGQFTSMFDGNNREIYEGDITVIPETMINNKINGVVIFDKGQYFVQSLLSGTNWSLAWSVSERQIGEPRAVIVGNIYD